MFTLDTAIELRHFIVERLPHGHRARNISKGYANAIANIREDYHADITTWERFKTQELIASVDDIKSALDARLFSVHREIGKLTFGDVLDAMNAKR